MFQPTQDFIRPVRKLQPRLLRIPNRHSTVTKLQVSICFGVSSVCKHVKPLYSKYRFCLTRMFCSLVIVSLLLLVCISFTFCLHCCLPVPGEGSNSQPQAASKQSQPRRACESWTKEFKHISIINLSDGTQSLQCNPCTVKYNKPVLFGCKKDLIKQHDKTGKHKDSVAVVGLGAKPLLHQTTIKAGFQKQVKVSLTPGIMAQ